MSYRFLDQQFAFDVIGPANQTIVIEAATDFVTWSPRATNSLGTGPLRFSEPASQVLHSRFYRARVLPQSAAGIIAQ